MFLIGFGQVAGWLDGASDYVSWYIGLGVGFDGVAAGAVVVVMCTCGFGAETAGFGRDGVGLEIGPHYPGTLC